MLLKRRRLWLRMIDGRSGRWIQPFSQIFLGGRFQNDGDRFVPAHRLIVVTHFRIFFIRLRNASVFHRIRIRLAGHESNETEQDRRQ